MTIQKLHKSVLTQESFSIYRYIHRRPAICFYAGIIDPRLEKNNEEFKMLHYEARYFNKTEWEKISEVEDLESLQDAFVRITPALRDMIQGKQVTTTDAIYRIKGLG